MTSRERVIAALNRQQPDRVPIFELLIDPRVIEGLVPGGAYADLCDQFDLDMVITFTPSSFYRKEFLEEKDGVRYFRTEWGEIRADTGQMVTIPSGGFPIRTRQDLDRYTPPDPLAPERYQALQDLVQRFGGRRAVGMHLHDAFSYPTYLMGMQNLLTALYDDPALVHALVDLSAEHQATMAKRACELGADFILFGDDYCDTTGPLMSPQHFKEFFLPGLRRVVQTVKDCGVHVVKHTDGLITSILDMMIDAGIDAFHPCDPSAGLTIAQMKKRYGQRICVMGNIDTGIPLSDWPGEQVRDYVRQVLREGMPGGGWIISSANTIHDKVNPENYRIMLETVHQEGRYGG